MAPTHGPRLRRKLARATEGDITARRQPESLPTLGGAGLTPSTLLGLQRTLGNRAVGQILREPAAALRSLSLPRLSRAPKAAAGLQRAAGQPAAIQRFSNNILVDRELAALALPVGGQYNFSNGRINTLRQHIATYRQLEDPGLEYVRYRPEIQQVPILDQAIQQLSTILVSAAAVTQLTNGDQAYANFNAKLAEVVAAATADRNDLQALRQQALNTMFQAAQDAWTHWDNLYNLGVNPNSDALAASFNVARDAGIVQVFPNHWWSTGQYPGPNAQLEVRIWNYHTNSYAVWGYIHVKWHNVAPGALAHENVDMVNIKTPVNGTIPNSRINNQRAVNFFITEALKYRGSAPNPNSAQTPMH